MKINEVEKIIGITKKNIRFYEKEGLLSPCRNKENGYNTTRTILKNLRKSNSCEN